MSSAMYPNARPLQRSAAAAGKPRPHRRRRVENWEGGGLSCIWEALFGVWGPRKRI